jgi:hypothetical protein
LVRNHVAAIQRCHGDSDTKFSDLLAHNQGLMGDGGHRQAPR